MGIEVVQHSPEWSISFAQVRGDLARALLNVRVVAIEHVGSTSVPGLAAKPIIDIDVVVDSDNLLASIRALESAGYVHRGDLGVDGREAFHAPDETPKRNVYVCLVGSLSLRNHLGVRDVLRRRPDLRDAYGAVKLALATDPAIDLDAYIAGKSSVLQRVLAETDLSSAERETIANLNEGNPSAIDAPRPAASKFAQRRDPTNRTTSP